MITLRHILGITCLGVLLASAVIAQTPVARATQSDPKRIYPMGNSMGELGTLHLTQKYPKEWRAIAPSGRPVSEYPFQKVKGLAGAMFIRGKVDKGMGGNTNIARQKALADGFRTQGIDTKLVLVPGGNHSNAWYMVLPDIFDFFNHTDKPLFRSLFR